MDKNFWKDRYKDSWDKAALKEKMVVEQIEAHTGKQVTLVGLGAGTSDYLSGSAADNNATKGDADLYIADADTFIEVTGPNIPVGPADPLWIRPDKIKNSLTKIGKGVGKGHFVIHVIERKDNGKPLIRAIPMSEELLKFRTINPRIRGTVETYIEVPANYGQILPFDKFIEMISG